MTRSLLHPIKRRAGLRRPLRFQALLAVALWLGAASKPLPALAQSVPETNDDEGTIGVVMSCIGTFGYVEERASGDALKTVRSARGKLIEFYASLHKVSQDAAQSDGEIANTTVKAMFADGRATPDVLLATCNTAFGFDIQTPTH